MIKIFTIALFVSAAVPVVGQATFTLHPPSSKVLWKGKQVTGEHSGTIRMRAGTIDWGDQGLVGAEIEMDMTTITDTDMERQWAAELEDHLRSPDFFNTTAFRTATFRTTHVAPIDDAGAGKPNYRVTGDLTIKGITHPVTFDVLAWKDNRTVHVTGTLLFDRTLYDIKSRSGRFFDSLGDRMIDDMVELTFDVTGK
jgi:polyisoprenoid-binding protein YceI